MEFCIGTSKFSRFVQMENMEADRHVLTVLWGSEFTDTFLDIESGPHSEDSHESLLQPGQTEGFRQHVDIYRNGVDMERLSRARSLRT